MKNRKNYLKRRKRNYEWKQIGMFAINPTRACDKCGRLDGIIQIYKYDAWACINCNEWLEPVCSDPNCYFCSNRPAAPYEVYWDAVNGQKADGLMRKRWRQDNYAHKENGRRRHNRKSLYREQD